MLDLIARYSTFPHHKHTDDEVFESTETSVADVLNRINEELGGKTPLFITDRNDALSFAENDIKDNWELYKERFVKEGEI